MGLLDRQQTYRKKAVQKKLAQIEHDKWEIKEKERITMISKESRAEKLVQIEQDNGLQKEKDELQQYQTGFCKCKSRAEKLA